MNYDPYSSALMETFMVREGFIPNHFRRNHPMYGHNSLHSFHHSRMSNFLEVTRYGVVHLYSLYME